MERKGQKSRNDLDAAVNINAQLPPELWLLILSKCAIKDLCQFMQTCKHNQSLGGSDTLWQELCERYFVIQDAPSTDTNIAEEKDKRSEEEDSEGEEEEFEDPTPTADSTSELLANSWYQLFCQAVQFSCWMGKYIGTEKGEAAYRAKGVPGGQRMKLKKRTNTILQLSAADKLPKGEALSSFSTSSSTDCYSQKIAKFGICWLTQKEKTGRIGLMFHACQMEDYYDGNACWDKHDWVNQTTQLGTLALQRRSAASSGSLSFERFIQTQEGLALSHVGQPETPQWPLSGWETLLQSQHERRCKEREAEIEAFLVAKAAEEKQGGSVFFPF